MNATRDVCRQLIDARERLDLTVTQVARRGMWGHAQVSNIEAAHDAALAGLFDTLPRKAGTYQQHAVQFTGSNGRQGALIAYSHKAGAERACAHFREEQRRNGMTVDAEILVREVVCGEWQRADQ